MIGYSCNVILLSDVWGKLQTFSEEDSIEEEQVSDHDPCERTQPLLAL